MKTRIEDIAKKIKLHSEYKNVGMVLYHNGVVRSTSRAGKKVCGLKVEVDYDLLRETIVNHKKRVGIVEIFVEIEDNKDLFVGDDIMFIAVAGDIRENVVTTLYDILNFIKNHVVRKTEIFL